MEEEKTFPPILKFSFWIHSKSERFYCRLQWNTTGVYYTTKFTVVKTTVTIILLVVFMP